MVHKQPHKSKLIIPTNPWGNTDAKSVLNKFKQYSHKTTTHILLSQIFSAFFSTNNGDIYIYIYVFFVFFLETTSKYRMTAQKKNVLSPCISSETCKYLWLCLETAKNSTEKGGLQPTSTERTEILNPFYVPYCF